MRRFSLIIALLLIVTGIRTAVAEDEPHVPSPEEERNLHEVRIAVPVFKSAAKEQKIWARIAKRMQKELGKTVRFVILPKTSSCKSHAVRGRVGFALVSPEEFMAGVNTNGLTSVMAVNETNGRFGFQVGIMSRPEAPYENGTDVFSSMEPLGLLKLGGLKGRFYRGPVTDEDWRLLREIRERAVYAKDVPDMVRRLKSKKGKDKLDVALIPVDDLGELDLKGERSGLRELWLSPVYPGRVVVGRVDLGKLQRIQVANALISAADKEGDLTGVGIGGFDLTDDLVFEPLREFVEKPEI